MSDGLNLLGMLCEFIGIGIAAIGIRQTWREHGPAGERIWDEWRRVGWLALRRAGKWLEGVARGVLGRRKVELEVELTGRSSVSATLETRYAIESAALPKTNAAAIAALDRRFRMLADRVRDDREAAEAAMAQIRGEVRDLSGAIEGMQKDSQRIVVEGIRIESVGLLMVALGLGLQFVAMVI